MTQVAEQVDVEVMDTFEEARGSTAIEAVTRGQVDVQIRTAKAYPRSIQKFMRAATSMAIVNEATAKSCMYALKRGGKIIEGPSVRLAEICASSFGHIRAECRQIADDGRFVTCQGICWDLENNVAISTEVKRRITTKEGNRYSDDMVANTINAGNSIALRNAILRVIPRAFVDQIYEQARKVAVGDARTLDVRRQGTLSDLARMGVTEDRILAVVGKQALGDIGLDELAHLIGLFNRVKEEEATVDEAFPAPESGKPSAPLSKADKVNEKIQKTAEATVPASAPAPVDDVWPWAKLKEHDIDHVKDGPGYSVINGAGETLVNGAWQQAAGVTVVGTDAAADAKARKMAMDWVKASSATSAPVEPTTVEQPAPKPTETLKPAPKSGRPGPKQA